MTELKFETMEIFSSFKSWLIVLSVITFVFLVIRENKQRRKKLKERIIRQRSKLFVLYQKHKSDEVIFDDINTAIKKLGQVSSMMNSNSTASYIEGYVTCLEYYVISLEMFSEIVKNIVFDNLEYSFNELKLEIEKYENVLLSEEQISIILSTQSLIDEIYLSGKYSISVRNFGTKKLYLLLSCHYKLKTFGLFK